MIVCTKEFPGAPDGEVYPRQILAGEVLTGDLARVALENKWAKEVRDQAPKVDPSTLTLDEVIAGADDLKAAELKAEASRLMGKPIDGTKKEVVEALEAFKVAQTPALPTRAADLLAAEGLSPEAFQKAAAGILGDDIPEDAADVVAALELRAEADAQA